MYAEIFVCIFYIFVAVIFCYDIFMVFLFIYMFLVILSIFMNTFSGDLAIFSCKPEFIFAGVWHDISWQSCCVSRITKFRRENRAYKMIKYTIRYKKVDLTLLRTWPGRFFYVYLCWAWKISLKYVWESSSSLFKGKTGTIRMNYFWRGWKWERDWE